MDELIAGLPAERDGDLMLCRPFGVAYQAEVSALVPYDAAYFDKYVGYEGSQIAININAERIALVNRHAGPTTQCLDIGIGSGEFIKHRPHTFGFDINPKAVEWLKGWNKFADDFTQFSTFTFWDVIEHIPRPSDYFDKIAHGSFLFTSLPIFDSLDRIRESKHYRPNEHLYYFTKRGFIDWMAKHGFWVIEVTDGETRAGRESILSFAFRRADVRA